MRVGINTRGGSGVLAASDVTPASVRREIVKVARAHQPDGGYGETYWNESAAAVYWISADWTTNDEIDVARDAFLAIDGVDEFDSEAEAYGPQGDEWSLLWPESASARAGGERDSLTLAREPLDLSEQFEIKPDLAHFDVERDGWEGRVDTAAILEHFKGDERVDHAALSSALHAVAQAHKTTIESVATIVASALRAPTERTQSDSPALAAALAVIAQFASRPDPAITVNVPPTTVHVEGPVVNVPEPAPQLAPVVHVAAAESPVVNVTVPEQRPADVKVDVHVPPAEHHIEVASPAVQVDVHVPPAPEPQPRTVRVEYDDDGTKRFVQE